MPLALFREPGVLGRRARSASSSGSRMFGAHHVPAAVPADRQGVEPDGPGLRLLPMMAGLLLTSIVSGQLISRWGRYKVFPVVGTAVMTVGLFLLLRCARPPRGSARRLHVRARRRPRAGHAGARHRGAERRRLPRTSATATSGVTFFRSIGGSFGTAAFGAIFSAALTSNLAGVALPPGLSGGSVSPQQLGQLPPAARALFVGAYADSLQTVFLVAAPIGVVAFLVTLLLPEVPLRTAVGGDGQAAAAPFRQPEGRTSLQEVERQLAGLLSRENRPAMYRRLAARASLDLEPRQTGCSTASTSTRSAPSTSSPSGSACPRRGSHPSWSRWNPGATCGRTRRAATPSSS